MGGELAVEGWRVRAISHFPTVRLSGVALTPGVDRGRWYYEAVLLTDGLMQVGWAEQGFTCDPLGGQGKFNKSNASIICVTISAPMALLLGRCD